MNTDSIRLNITLPRDIADGLNKAAGPRQRNKFIIESLQERLLKLEKDQLEKRLVEGYRDSAGEGAAIAFEFEAADLEGWDDY